MPSAMPRTAAVAAPPVLSVFSVASAFSVPSTTSPPTSIRACSGVSGVSLTAWNAIRRLRAPSSSRTLSISSVATASSTPSREGGAPLLGLAAEDGDAGLVVRSGDVDDQPAGEAPDEPLVERLDLRRRAIAGEHDLAAGGLERVGEPEQLRLHLPAMGQELHVVHQQQVDVEEPLAVRLAVTGGDGGVKRLDEFVEREIFDGEPRIDGPRRVADAPSAGGSSRVPAGRR